MQKTKPIIDFDFWGQNIYMFFGAIGIFFALIVFLQTSKKNNCSPTKERKLILCLVLSLATGVSFANITNWFYMPHLLQEPLWNRIQLAGFNFYSGLVFFLISLFTSLKLFKLDALFWMNKIVPSIIILHAFGRIGCSLAGCCYGTEMFHQETSHFHYELFPAREIESLSLFILFFIFKFKIQKNELSLYLIIYSILRFALEFFRGDNRGRLIFNSFSPAQIISVCVLSIILIYYTYKKIKTLAKSV